MICLWMSFASVICVLLPVDSNPFQSSAFASTSVSASDEREREEVFLSFRYRGIRNVVVIAMYEDGQIYLPVTELFDQLGIYHQTDFQNLRIHGHYIDQNHPYEIQFADRTAMLRGASTSFSIDEMLIGELDFYLVPEVFDEVFGLAFSVDMSRLVLRLQTSDTMPVVTRLEREQRRQRIEQGVQLRQFYPIEFERDRQLFSGGFMDYSLTGNVTDQYNSASYTLSLGAELLGGDIQGNMFGSHSQVSSNFTTSGLRWRYVFENRSLLTQARIGQYRTEGPHSRHFQGIHLTNQPVEPRRMLDEFVFSGTAPAQSNVELFINNRLVDFQEVDELGNYRFLVPLTYGNSRVRLMVYEPDGQIREQDRRIQVPFTFLPPGEFNYHLSAGRMDYPVPGTTNISELASGDFTYGVSNWLTARAGGEYLTAVHHSMPFLYGGLSARLFNQYLMNIDLAPDIYYRFSTSVVYPNSISWDLGVTGFADRAGLYNPERNDFEANANFFVPVQLGTVPIHIRFHGNHRNFGIGHTNRLRGDASIRLGRINLRGGYRNSYRFLRGDLLSTDGRFSGTATYSMSRSPEMPGWLRGLYLRGQLDYNMRRSQLERVNVQISRSVFRNGRFRISYARNFIGGYNILEGVVTFDLNRTRSTTSARRSLNTGTIRQNIRGSIGYDDFHHQLVFENRQQVGRSAASVRLFVDRNNNGTYEESDELIRANAIRLDRSGSSRLHDDGVVRITQVQQYYQNNMMINLGMIPNPLLVPVIRDFSFIADPNRFKPIDIPFYTSGVIDGMVMRQRGDERRGLGGVRVQLRQTDGDYRETIRTFSDGSWYAMEIPPGHYEAWVDTTQQEFLNAVADPAVMQFEIQALSEGDFLENLNFVLHELEPVRGDEILDEEEAHQILSENSQRALRLYVAAHESMLERDFDRSLNLINQSLEHNETDYGRALKGTLLFLPGRPDDAGRYWQEATEQNSEISIPEMDVLEHIITQDQARPMDKSKSWY